MPDTASRTRSWRDRHTRQRLLLGGAAAGLTGFVVTFLVEGATRPGYSPWRHAVSQLSLGPLGWVNTIAILLTGLALLAFAVGLRRALPTGTGSTWGPRLLGVTGAGFLLAAAFPDDPGLGYPPGTLAQQSLSGLIHGLVITVAFGCLSAACFVMARRFAGDPAWRGWARYSTVTGLLPNAPGGLIQRVTIITGFGWVVLLAARLLRQQQSATTI